MNALTTTCCSRQIIKWSVWRRLLTDNDKDSAKGTKCSHWTRKYRNVNTSKGWCMQTEGRILEKRDSRLGYLCAHLCGWSRPERRVWRPYRPSAGWPTAVAALGWRRPKTSPSADGTCTTGHNHLHGLYCINGSMHASPTAIWGWQGKNFTVFPIRCL